MKKIILLTLSLLMVLSLAGCGAKTNDDPETTPEDQETAVTEDNADSEDESDSSSPAGDVPEAKDGVLTITTDSIAIIVNGEEIKAPFKFEELTAAGLTSPAETDVELNPGDMFLPNMYADENEDYVISPNYENNGDSVITLGDAEALSISMSSYADSPEDVGVSVFGVKFGMSKSDVISILGESQDDSDGLYYTVSVSDNSDLEGSLTITFIDDRVDYLSLSIY